jgi:P pilus assembly chaperone PapD
LTAYALGIASVIGCASTPAHAQLAIDRLWVDFEPGAANRADVVIRNESKDRYYITVTPVEIVEPGTDSETRVQTADPEKLGLLVSPNRLIVEPGGMRSIRVVSLNEALSSDRVYRVKVTPQVGAIDAPATQGDAKGVSVKLLTAYDLLVTARPPKPKADILNSRSGDTLTLQNNGNTNVLLFEGRACPQGVRPQAADPGKAAAAPTNGCVDLGARRLYPGNSWSMPVPAGTARLYFKQRTSAAADPRDVEYSW